MLSTAVLTDKAEQLDLFKYRANGQINTTVIANFFVYISIIVSESIGNICPIIGIQDEVDDMFLQISQSNQK